MVSGAAVAVATLSLLAFPNSGDADDSDFFERLVRPILANQCFACHGPQAGDGQAGLRLDSRDGMLRGGRSGPAIVPGRAAESLLIHAVNHDTALQMPPKSKLTIDQVASLTRWVDKGARWPNARTPAPRMPERVAAETGFSDEERSHWAFQPPSDPRPPPGGSTPVDAFVLARLDAAGLKPAPEASRRALIRRATMDLHGLLPTTDEVRNFRDDASDAAFERLVDRLLASPRYGERWGRHWLDVARYADSNGMDDNIVHGDAWRYRDYVIRAFNRDRPYDRFIREQLAGDVITEWDDADRAQGLVATGFLMLGPKMVGEDDPVKQKLDFADEQLATTSRAFLALSIDCARCHDHKFDPIRSSDYYAMLGMFTSTKTVLSYRVTSKLNATALGGPRDDRRLSEIERRFDYHSDFLTNYNRATTPRRVVEAQQAALDEALEDYFEIAKAMAVAEGDIEDLPVMVRGSHLTPGELAPRQFPAILTDDRQPPIDGRSSGRRELAEWLTRPGHPLTSRVMVNRVWKWHFGEGIVRTPDNFGTLGDRPDHPALLDWLASRFVEDNWSVKALHRRIMLSGAYRRSYSRDEHASLSDPENRLLWRANRRRMEAEAIRDSLLAVAGQLDLAMDGKTLRHRNFTNLNADALSRDPSLYDTRRRSVYLPVLRSALYELFAAFDFANPSTTTGSRSTTMVAPQALFMMNSKLIKAASREFAARLAGEAAEAARRIELAHEIAYSRRPREDEVTAWADFLRGYEVAGGTSDGAWQAMCRVLLSTNEFLYIQ